MKTEKKPDINQLFNRVVTILEEARTNVVRVVNSNMVIAYWLIGREIVEEIQGGEDRADYGKQVVEELSCKLTVKYGKGFSASTLWRFRQFYQVFQERIEILVPAGRESGKSDKIVLKGRELGAIEKPSRMERELTSYFSSQLSWSHYRALIKVKKDEARQFYEQEAIECGWSKTQLERQIHTSYYERILSHHGEQGLLPAKRERLSGDATEPIDILKSPMVLEFLGLPDSADLHESDLEQGIITHLQNFLLELGKGFAFVARQKRLIFGE